jgi:PAS domain S-box-containing protein
MAFFFLEEVVDSLSDALITVDQNRKVIIWNEMAKRMFGYDKAEIQQMGLEAIIPPAYLQRHREAYGRFVEHIDARNSFVSKIKQFEALRNTGELFPIELTHSMFGICRYVCRLREACLHRSSAYPAATAFP